MHSIHFWKLIWGRVGWGWDSAGHSNVRRSYCWCNIYIGLDIFNKNNFVLLHCSFKFILQGLGKG